MAACVCLLAAGACCRSCVLGSGWFGAVKLAGFVSCGQTQGVVVSRLEQWSCCWHGAASALDSYWSGDSVRDCLLGVKRASCTHLHAASRPPKCRMAVLMSSAPMVLISYHASDQDSQAFCIVHAAVRCARVTLCHPVQGPHHQHLIPFPGLQLGNFLYLLLVQDILYGVKVCQAALCTPCCAIGSSMGLHTHCIGLYRDVHFCKNDMLELGLRRKLCKRPGDYR